MIESELDAAPDMPEDGKRPERASFLIRIEKLVDAREAVAHPVGDAGGDKPPVGIPEAGDKGILRRVLHHLAIFGLAHRRHPAVTMAAGDVAAEQLEMFIVMNGRPFAPGDVRIALDDLAEGTGPLEGSGKNADGNAGLARGTGRTVEPAHAPAEPRLAQLVEELPIPLTADLGHHALLGSALEIRTG